KVQGLFKSLHHKPWRDPIVHGPNDGGLTWPDAHWIRHQIESRSPVRGHSSSARMIFEGRSSIDFQSKPLNDAVAFTLRCYRQADLGALRRPFALLFKVKFERFDIVTE